MMERPDEQSAADLVQIAKRALDAQSAEKQRAHVDHADVPHQAWLNAPGDTLDLSKQGATALPVEVIDLIKDRVERLALSHNNQIFLPHELSFCSRLFYLNLRWNNFTQFPESVLLLTNLQTLDLSRNNLTSIPDGISRMTSLKFLAFTNNQVTHLPLCMGDMTSLTRLKMDDNPIQFPSPDEWTPSPEARNRNGFESNTYVAGQVKRFMRREKERHRQETESEMSESNLETPRPLRRTNTGRFPVRPSMGSAQDTHQSMGSVGSANGDVRIMSPEPPRFYQHTPGMPPHRPMAKDSLAIPPVRRPGLAPLAIQGYANRSRSETIATGGQKLKRHGFVPSRKTSGPPSANSLNRDHQSVKPTHLRTASYAPGPDDESVVRANPMSPADAVARQPWVSRSRLSSLPEDRRVSKINNPTIRSARLLVYSLDQLNRPMDDVIRIIRSESPQPSTAERLHINATQNLKELDAQLHILTPLTEQQRPESKELRQILRRSRYCVQAYHQVVSQLRLNARKLVLRGDPVYLRSLMLQIHACLLEVRNACAIQETTLIPPPPPARFSSISQARSDRTVTPTQSKPSSKRSRGAKIMATMRKESPMSATYSNPMLSSASSRTTTMTSMSLATPKSGDSFNPIIMSATNSVTSMPYDNDEAWQFEKIYLSLRQVCDLADQTLVSCRQDLFVRKEGAARNMSSSAARAWALALNKCDSLMHAFDLLKEKLARVRLNDPSNRKSRDFWVVCDGVFNAWYDLASEMKVLGSQGLDIGSVKPLLRPLQKAIKEASHMVNTSSVSRRAFDARSGGANGSLHHQNMPPTPLSAALGPAAQATVPNTPGVVSGVVSPADHWYNYRYEPKERERERSDTVTSRYGNGYRGR